MILALEGGGRLDLELAAAGNTEVVRAKRRTMSSLKLNDRIEDILISLNTQYHLIRPLESNDAIFLYVALDRKMSNLALARMAMKTVEQSITF
jgi:predicted regulator of Ras-like GTPase activity (Roadblock/LC7/MglB family)